MTAHAKKLLEVCHRVEQVVLGKTEAIKLLLTAFLAGGHVLLEDRPGVGKSTLARTFASALGLELKRIQVTADLMPLDVIGGNVFNKETGRLTFSPGPVFSNIVMLDELNRASARTQSALLEAMEEAQVTVDGTSYALPQPFFVIATQNSIEHQGTYEIPDSQLDRFLMKLSLGLPSRNEEGLILKRLQHSVAEEKIFHKAEKVFSDPGELIELKQSVEKLHVEQAVIDYILDLALLTRTQFSSGLSPRASIGLLKAAKAYAFLAERDYVSPDDVKAVFAATAMHRLGIPAKDSLALARIQSMSSKLKKAPSQQSMQEDLAQWILTQIKIRLAS